MAQRPLIQQTALLATIVQMLEIKQTAHKHQIIQLIRRFVKLLRLVFQEISILVRDHSNKKLQS